MQRNLINKSLANSLVVLLVACGLGLSGCKRHSEAYYWLLCFKNAVTTTDKFAVKKGKNLELYRTLGIFNYKGSYLHIYYAGKKGAADDFVVELNMKTCKPRFGDKLGTDNPEIVDIANKYMVERGKNLSVYEIPEITKDAKEWSAVYRRINSGQDDGLIVGINEQTHETLLIGPSGEIPAPKKIGVSTKPPEPSPSNGPAKANKPTPCNAPGCRGEK